MTGVHHSLTIVNRNTVDGITSHRHPHLPTCACGWFGVPRRRRSGAERQYHAHLANKTRTSTGGGRARPVTPVDQLPETLR